MRFTCQVLRLKTCLFERRILKILTFAWDRTTRICRKPPKQCVSQDRRKRDENIRVKRKLLVTYARGLCGCAGEVNTPLNRYRDEHGLTSAGHTIYFSASGSSRSWSTQRCAPGLQSGCVWLYLAVIATSPNPYWELCHELSPFQLWNRAE